MSAKIKGQKGGLARHSSAKPSLAPGKPNLPSSSFSFSKELNLKKEREAPSAPAPNNVKFSSYEEIREIVPIVTWEKWVKKYGSASWIDGQLASAFDYHNADPAAVPRTKGAWLKKLHTWFEIAGKQKGPEKKTDLELLQMFEEEDRKKEKERMNGHGVSGHSAGQA